MPAKRKPSDLSDLHERYLSGVRAEDLGAELGVTGNRVLIWFHQDGLRVMSRAEGKALHRAPIDIPAIVSRYTQGESINAIAKSLGLARMTIERRLLANGVKLRTQSEAEAVKWSRMSPDQRASQVRPAHAAAKVKLRGRRKTAAHLAARALGRQGGRMTAGEVTVSNMLTRADIHHIPQQAEGPYNIDLGVTIDTGHEFRRIAVEVLSTYASRSYGPKLRKKVEHLLDRGWFVLFVYIMRGNSNDMTRVEQDLIACIDEVGSDQTGCRAYRVVRGDSQRGPIFKDYLDGIACIDCSGCSIEDAADGGTL